MKSLKYYKEAAEELIIKLERLWSENEDTSSEIKSVEKKFDKLYNSFRKDYPEFNDSTEEVYLTFKDAGYNLEI